MQSTMLRSRKSTIIAITALLMSLVLACMIIMTAVPQKAQASDLFTRTYTGTVKIMSAEKAFKLKRNISSSPGYRAGEKVAILFLNKAVKVPASGDVYEMGGKVVKSTSAKMILLSDQSRYGTSSSKLKYWKKYNGKKVTVTGQVVKRCVTNADPETYVADAVLYNSQIKRYKPAVVKLSKTTFKYNSKAKNPKVIAKTSKGKVIPSKYYKVKKSPGRTKVGTYKYTITFKGKYKGTYTRTFKIKR